MAYVARRRDRPTTVESPENVRAYRALANNLDLNIQLPAPGALKMVYIVAIYACYSDPSIDKAGTVSWDGVVWQYFTTKNPFTPNQPASTFPNKEIWVSLPASGVAAVWGSLTVIWYSKGYIS